jgi:hypothetical protein
MKRSATQVDAEPSAHPSSDASFARLRCLRPICGVLASLVLADARPAASQPMDLASLQSRWVRVEVVLSPPDVSGRRLSEPALAWYESGPGPTQRTVIVPSAVVERVLLADRNPVDRSFSDYVWVFDATTGHVVSASFSGLVDERLRLGPIDVSARVSISAVLTSLAAAGYRAPTSFESRSVVGFCADPGAAGCTEVASSGLDPSSGWVRANGPVSATWRSLEVHAFTPLGHARFLEQQPDRGRSDVLLTDAAGSRVVETRP